MTVPFAPLGLDHVVLRTAGVERMIAFYVDVIGCHVEKEQPKFGLTQLRAGRALIDIVDVHGQIGRLGGGAPGREGRNMDHFCLRIDPWDETAIQAHLDANGIEVGESGQRFGAEGMGPSIYIADPDGNTVELKGPPGG